MSKTPKYKGGVTASIGVKNLKKSLEWYTTKLGFKHLYTVDEIQWAECATGLAGLNIGLGQRESVPTGGGATLTLGVEDIDAARALIESQGVKFEGPTHTIPGMVKLCTFYDPDGNSLMFFQDLQSHG